MLECFGTIVHWFASLDVLSTPRKVQKRSLNPLQAIGSSAECSLCKFIISYLDNVIQNNKSEAAIEAALDQVCKILPGALVDKCKQFVNIYGPVIPQLIIHYGTPEQVCNALKACNNGTQVAAPTPRKFDFFNGVFSFVIDQFIQVKFFNQSNQSATISNVHCANMF